MNQTNLRFGWAALLVFLLLGGTLESMHGFKVGWYLDVSNETRRHMWTLAHAHGTLLGLVNIAYALTLPRIEIDARRQTIASRCFIASGVLIPVGFLLGGVDAQGGDPGLGILLVPFGALLLATGALLTALARYSTRQQ